MKTQLLFKNLFDEALKEWPEEISFGDLTRYNTPDGETGYSIEGFLGFPDEIEHRYLNHQDEVIMLGIHYRIYNILGYSAKDFLKVRLQDLRPETVQKEFEDHIKSGLENPKKLKWNSEDVQLVKDYFAVNYSAEK